MARLVVALIAFFAITTSPAAAGVQIAPSDAVQIPATGGSFDSASVLIAVAQRGLAVADFDGDGKLDAAVSNLGDEVVTLVPGNGDGTFGPPANFPADKGAAAIASADFNGDHNADVVLARPWSPSEILLGTGDGRLGAPQTVGVPATGVTTGDFNGDSHDDIAFAYQFQQPWETGNGIHILLGNGDGSFQADRHFDTTFGPLDIATADFDGDGSDDVAVALPSSWIAGLITSYHLDAGAVEQLSSVTTAVMPLSVAAGPLGGDSHPDVVAGAGSWGQTGPPPAFAYSHGSPSGQLGSVALLPVALMPPAVAVVDLDGDGRGDAIGGSSQHCPGHSPERTQPQIAAALSDATGTLQTAIDVVPCVDQESPAQYAGSVVAADLNADGWTDLVAKDASSNVLVAGVNSPAADATPSVLDFANVAQGVRSESRRVTVSNVGAPPLRLSTIKASGPDAAAFTFGVDQCSGHALTGGTSCAIDVVFTPQRSGSHSATLAIDGGGGLGGDQVALTGVGVEPVAPVVQQQQVAGVKTALPVLGLTFPRQRLARVRGIAVLIRCDRQCTLHASGSVTIAKPHKTLKLGKAGTELRSAGTARVTLRLDRSGLKRALRALKRHARVTSRIAVTARNGAGTTRPLTRTLRLR